MRLVTSIALACTMATYAVAHDRVDLDSINVTANKIEENIQEVPQSISILDSEYIAEKGMTSIEDIINDIPNMNSYQESGVAVNFRGLNTSLFTNNNPVVVYVDGIPSTDRFDYSVSLANAQRVEVLRGPQGTLYGKDAIGGVINIITKEPTNETEIEVSGQVESNNHKIATINTSGAIEKDKLFLGLSYQKDESDGWMKDNLNSKDKEKISANLLYKANDRLSARVVLTKLDLLRNGGTGYGKTGASVNINDFSRDEAKKVTYDSTTYEKQVSDAQSLTISYKFDEATLDLVTTHKKLDFDGKYDLDFNGGNNFDGMNQFNDTQRDEITQEIRVSQVKDGLKWVTGLYLDKGERKQGPYGMSMPGMHQNAISTTDTDTNAIFSQGIFALTPQLDLTLGGRYQEITTEIDQKMLTNQTQTYAMKDKKSWDTFLSKLALTYKHSNNLTPYVSISQGYMPGGYNYYSMAGTAEDNSFKPQQTTNFEVGVKGSLDDFIFSANVFKMDIEDIHVYKVSNGMFLTDNAKKAHSQGVEVDFRYLPTDELDISGSIGIIDAEYDDYDTGTKKFDGERIEQTPSHKATLNIRYQEESGYYSLLSVKKQGSMTFQNAGTNLFEKVDGYTSADVKLGLKRDNWEAFVYGKNITDEEYITNYRSNGMVTTASFNDPQSFGIGGNYKF